MYDNRHSRYEAESAFRNVVAAAAGPGEMQMLLCVYPAKLSCTELLQTADLAGASNTVPCRRRAAQPGAVSLQAAATGQPPTYCIPRQLTSRQLGRVLAPLEQERVLHFADAAEAWGGFIHSWVGMSNTHKSMARSDRHDVRADLHALIAC